MYVGILRICVNKPLLPPKIRASQDEVPLYDPKNNASYERFLDLVRDTLKEVRSVIHHLVLYADPKDENVINAKIKLLDQEKTLREAIFGGIEEKAKLNSSKFKEAVKEVDQTITQLATYERPEVKKVVSVWKAFFMKHFAKLFKKEPVNTQNDNFKTKMQEIKQSLAVIKERAKIKDETQEKAKIKDEKAKAAVDEASDINRLLPPQ